MPPTDAYVVDVNGNDSRALAALMAMRVGFPVAPSCGAVEWHLVSTGLADWASRHGVLTFASESPAVERLPPDIRTQLRQRRRARPLNACGGQLRNTKWFKHCKARA